MQALQQFLESACRQLNQYLLLWEYDDLGNDWNRIKQKYDLTDSEMFEYFNKPVLDEAISNGKSIRFSHNPINYRTGALVEEWEYIKTILGKSDSNLYFEGGFWYVK